jgi:hypothetical protein
VHDGFRTYLMVFRIVTGVISGVITGGDEVYQHHSSAWVFAGGIYAHLYVCGPLHSSRRGKNPASPWRVSLESANLALVRVYGFLIKRIEAIWPRWGVNKLARKFKLFLQSNCQGLEVPRLFPEPPNGATSENNHGTSEIC